MSTTRRLVASAVAITAVLALTACGPPTTGRIGVGVDAAGRPVGFLKVCEGEHLDGAFLDTEPLSDSSPVVAVWDARPPATGSTSWSFQNPEGTWAKRRAVPALKPNVLYHLSAGTNDNSGTTGYVLFTLEDLKVMKPGQVRVYNYDRRPPAGEPTGSPAQQARDENEGFMRVITQADFEGRSCLG